MPYALDARGNPTFLISTMAMHTQNVLADGRASLLVTEPGAAEDPLGAGRVTLMGRVARTAGEDVREDYLARHPNAGYWVDFKDFAFFRMETVDVYFVGGFGVMGWVEAEEYARAEPDPLADTAAGILAHMNEDHVDAMLLLARGFGGIEGRDARMTAVDRLGFHLLIETSDGMRGLRVPFLREARSPQETREILVEMVRRERQS
jgi:putative heme iron utilization protein